MPNVMPYTVSMRKTSIYLDDEQAGRLARLARAEGRPQAEIVREAIACYRPAPKRDRNFALAGPANWLVPGRNTPEASVVAMQKVEGFESLQPLFTNSLQNATLACGEFAKSNRTTGRRCLSGTRPIDQASVSL